MRNWRSFDLNLLTVFDTVMEERNVTPTSTRVRGEPNAFNVLRIEPESIVVEHLVWSAAARAFTIGETQRFQRTPEGWTTP